jgi:hypothetical protein
MYYIAFWKYSEMKDKFLVAIVLPFLLWCQQDRDDAKIFVADNQRSLLNI